MTSQHDQDLQFWDNPNSPNYNLVNQSQPRTLLERAMPILVVILTIMVAILLPLAISNHVKVSNNEGKTQPFTFLSCPPDLTTNSKNKNPICLSNADKFSIYHFLFGFFFCNRDFVIGC